MHLHHRLEQRVPIRPGRFPAGAHNLIFFSLPRFEPFFEGTLAFTGGLAGQNIFHADVLVQVRPVDAFAAADEPPLGAFARRAVQQARIPRERRGHGASVGQFQGQRVFGHGDVLRHGFTKFNR